MIDPTPETLSSAELQFALEKACEKLIYISETDSPVEPFIDSKIDEMSPAAVATALERKPSEKMEQLEFRAFFEKLTRDRDWHNAVHRRMTKRYAELDTLLESNLQDAKVFRFGTIYIDLFVVRQDADGNLAGARTIAVDTSLAVTVASTF